MSSYRSIVNSGVQGLAAMHLLVLGEFCAGMLFFAPVMFEASAEPNRVSQDTIALGATLFSDPRLSRDGTMSCASCHDPAHAFTTPNPPRRAGLSDARLRRDVPSLLGVKDVPLLHHDGSEPSLETQILAPLFNASEMANTTFEELTARINAVDEYRNAFDAAFGEPATIENLGAAIASYERSLRALGAPFDDWQGMIFHELPAPDTGPAIPVENGFALFTGKAGCVSCHAIGGSVPPINASFTNHDFINTGIGFESEQRRARETPDAPADRGREEVTHSHEDRYKFRTPTLRNVELTAPYMHDGSLKTLKDVIAYYNAGGSPDPDKDPRIKPLGLTAEEQQQLLAFLLSLTSESLPGAKRGSTDP
jgi:cytochrome c peroxidase